MFSLLQKRETGLTSPTKLYNASKANKYFIQRLRLEQRLEVHRGCVNTICWNESGTRILSGSDDQHLVVSDPFTGQAQVSIRSGHHSNIFCAKFLPNSQDHEIVSCSGAGSIYYTQVDREDLYGKCLFDCHVGTTYELVVVPNEARTFLTCGEDGTVRWFDLRIKTNCNKERCKEDVLINCRNAVTSISVDPVLPFQLATACADGSVRVFDRRMLGTRLSGNYNNRLMTGLVSCFLAPLENKAHRITSLNYSPFSHNILVSYSAENVYLFNTQLEESKQFSKSEIGNETKEPVNGVEAAGSDPMNQPPTKRLRLRGDWSDTGPNARPERERTDDTEGPPQVNLMQRMSDMLTRWLDGSLRRRGDGQEVVSVPGAEGENSEPNQATGGSTDRVSAEVNRSDGQPEINLEVELDQENQGERMEGNSISREETSPHVNDQEETMDSQNEELPSDCSFVCRSSIDAEEDAVCNKEIPVNTRVVECSEKVDMSTAEFSDSCDLKDVERVLEVGEVGIRNDEISNKVAEDWVALSEGKSQIAAVPQSSESTSRMSVIESPCSQLAGSICRLNVSIPTGTITSENSVSSEPVTHSSVSENAEDSQNYVSLNGHDGDLGNCGESSETVRLQQHHTVPHTMSATDCVPESDERQCMAVQSSLGVQDADAPDVAGSKPFTQMVERAGPAAHQERVAINACPIDTSQGRTDTSLGAAVYNQGMTEATCSTAVSNHSSIPANMRLEPVISLHYSEEGTTASTIHVAYTHFDIVDPRNSQTTSQPHGTPVVTTQPQELPDSTASHLLPDFSPHQRRITVAETSVRGAEGGLPREATPVEHPAAQEQSHPQESNSETATPSLSANVSSQRDCTAQPGSTRHRRMGHSGPPTGDFQLVLNENYDEDSEDEEGDQAGLPSRSVPFWSYSANSNDERHYAAMCMQSVYRRRLEEREKQAMASVFQPQPQRMYTGHRNSRTMIKESNFWGENVVMSGSDCGRIFLWDCDSTELIMLLEADRHVVNCLQPHPFDPVLASSGIDYDVKIWSPLEAEPCFDKEMAEEVMRRNQIMLEETRDTITVPAAFMLRVLASLNQIRAGRAGSGGGGHQQQDSPADSD